MRYLSSKTTFVITLALGTVTVTGAATPRAQAAQSAAPETVAVKKPNSKRMAAHLKDHVQYPATRAQVLAACADAKEFSAAEKAWFAQALPEGTYTGPDAVLKALKKK